MLVYETIVCNRCTVRCFMRRLRSAIWLYGTLYIIVYVASCGGRGQSFIAWPDNDNDKPIILRPKEREDWQTNETVTFSRRIKRTGGDATQIMD